MTKVDIIELFFSEYFNKEQLACCFNIESSKFNNVKDLKDYISEKFTLNEIIERIEFYTKAPIPFEYYFNKYVPEEKILVVSVSTKENEVRYLYQTDGYTALNTEAMTINDFCNWYVATGIKSQLKEEFEKFNGGGSLV